MDHESQSKPSDDASSPADANLDDGLAFAYGDDEAGSTSPSVLHRIAASTGSNPKVNLREVPAGDTPMLKPLGPDDRVDAGKYVVQGELGRGGVGTVHKGHDQDLGRDVALKFLHEKYKDEPSILHRFVEEAQIGGQLQHPGIVPVYDLGMSDGKPFFSMKLVRGQTLAKKLADRESLTDDRRTFLAIFEDICQTLAYAHVRGVVHRDLKPANIMIGSFGEVQVVDWGMGKVLASGGVADEKHAAEQHSKLSVIETVRSSGQGTQSVIGSVMGTPAYMPPEQARGDVDAMDERSDVFALGAILCEILTGLPPYTGDQNELIAQAAMARLDDANARLAACGGEPEMVELATRCLMPAPAARPKSAEAVAQNVHAHLAAVEQRVHDARVEAAEAKVRAAALKRTQTLGISLTVVIAIGFAASLWFWQEARTAAANEKTAKLAAQESAKTARDKEQLAVEQTRVAERELARAIEIKRLITEMLANVDPKLAKMADTKLLRGILDTAAKRIEEDAIHDPLVEAELRSTIGHTYAKIGEYQLADIHLPIALDIHRRELGNDDPTTHTSVHNLAYALCFAGQLDDAERLATEAIEARTRTLGEEHPHTLESKSCLVQVYGRKRQLKLAERMCLDVLETRRRVLGREHTDTVSNIGNLSIIYSYQGQHEKAEALIREALDIQLENGRKEDLETLTLYTALGTCLWSQGKPSEAEEVLLKARDAILRALGPEHPITLSSTNSLALVEHELGKVEQAERRLRDALAISRRAMGNDNPVTQALITQLGNVCKMQMDFESAEPLLREALEICRRRRGEEHEYTLGAITNLGLLYCGMGRLEDGVKLLETSFPIKLRVLGVSHPYTSAAMGNLLEAYRMLGRNEDATKVERDFLAASIAEKTGPDASPTALIEAARTLLTHPKEALRNPVMARTFAQRACATESSHDKLWSFLDTLALAQFRTGDTEAAIKSQRRALSLMPADADPDVAKRLAEYEADLERDGPK